MANNNLLATRSMALIIKYIHITPEKHKYIYFLRNKKYAIKKKNKKLLQKAVRRFVLLTILKLQSVSQTFELGISKF